MQRENIVVSALGTAEAVGIQRRPSEGYETLKRGIDVVGALILIVALLPLLVFLALLIQLDGGHPIYLQERLGRGGRVFRMWKFRTMVPDAQQRLAAYLQTNDAARLEWEGAQKLRKDPRVTPVGRVLRKYSLDELPQLWNVLIGDMSLVGPRPMFEEQRALYPGQAYFLLRPGMTGPWQVSDRNNSPFSERGRFDTEYAQTLSLKGDLAIMLRTVSVVLRGTGC